MKWPIGNVNHSPSQRLAIIHALSFVRCSVGWPGESEVIGENGDRFAVGDSRYVHYVTCYQLIPSCRHSLCSCLKVVWFIYFREVVVCRLSIYVFSKQLSMSLSSSTLSLKFMQRGLARAAASTPQQQRDDSKPSSSAGPSTPTPAATGNSNDRPEEISQALAREEQAKWFIPRQHRSVTASTSQTGDGGVQVKFEASYAPFLPGYEESQDEEDEEEDKDVFETQAGGGRMVFGGFGKAKGKEKAGEEEGEGDDDERMEEDEEVKNKRAKPLTKKKPMTKVHNLFIG